MPILFHAQKSEVIQDLDKLQGQKRNEAISAHLKKISKTDTAQARKETIGLLKHFEKDKATYAYLLTQRASQLFKAKNDTAAIEAQTRAMNIYEGLKDTESEMTALGKLTIYYNHQRLGNKLSALFFEKLKKAEGNLNKEAYLYLRIGVHFKDEIKDREKALYYLQQADERYQRINDSSEQIITDKVSVDKNSAVIYRDKNDYEKALFHYNKALALCDAHHMDAAKAVVLNSMGNCYQEMLDFPKAIQVYEQSVKIKEGTDDIGGLSTTKANLAQLYLKIKNYNRAEVLGLSSYSLALKANVAKKIMESSNTLYEVYDALKKPIKAYPYLKQAYKLRDSLYNTSIAEQTAELEARFDTEKKEKEIELSNLKNAQLQDTVETTKRERTMVLVGSSVLLLLLVFAIRSYLGKRKANVLLEDKNKLIVQQKHVVEEQHQEILDSITYAKRLQDAILPPEEEVSKLFGKNYFIYYCPRSIVAGDFYWMEKINDEVFMAAADCTGHGVPGAMVSMVCSGALSRAVYEYHMREPGKILDKTRDLVLENFAKSKSEVKDGMDISLVSINLKTLEVKWAGANNPLWYIKDNELIEITANKQPIGKADNYVPFTTHVLDVKKGDSLYLFTDGYADQFGGPKGKKLKYKQMQEIIMGSKDVEITSTNNDLRERFDAWKGELEQVDDVCVIGIRL